MSAQSTDYTEITNVYLFPGQGSDYRLFEEFKFPEKYNVHHISLPIPSKRWMTMPEYAMQISEQMDTTGKTICIGVSLGGMICTELNKVLDIDTTIVISSAKCRNELPFRYRFQKYVPLYLIVPKRLMKWGSYIAQPLFEPDRKVKKEVCAAMLKSKNPVYLKRTVGIIIRWEGEVYNDNIVHIHGDNDHTIPIRNVKHDYRIENGSHMMAFTRGKEINNLIGAILEYED